MKIKKNSHKEPYNPWSPEDEGDHNPVMKEWWTIETLFQTLKDNRKWNLIASFSYKNLEKTCFFQYVLFDITNKKHVACKDVDDSIENIITSKNQVNVQYDKSYIKGVYPNYNIHIEDDEADLSFDVNYNANSYPHWIAQNKTNGFLPIGLNNYRYGFLPNCPFEGDLKLGDESYKIKGKGYLEHAYGNWSYRNPFRVIKGLNKTISIYSKLGRWWLNHNKIKIPKKISFTTENNIFGYDWVWGIFENDWSIFFGNSMFWVKEGPSFAALYLTKDGRNYLEFCNVRFKYLKEIHIKEYDMYYPYELELIGKLDDKKIDIVFKGTTEPYEYIDPYHGSKMYRAWVLCELPGRMKGTYSDSNSEVELEGDCKIVPLRLPSALGHNSIDFEFLHPPKSVGLKINVNSHYLNKKLFSKLEFKPRPSFKFKVGKIK